MKQLQLSKKEFLEEILQLMNGEEDGTLTAQRKLVEKYGPESMVETVAFQVNRQYKYTKRYLIVYTLDGFVAVGKHKRRLLHDNIKSLDEEIILGIKEMMSMESKLKKEDEEKLIFILDRLKLQVAFYEK